jgi:general secretion pathway protein D
MTSFFRPKRFWKLAGITLLATMISSGPLLAQAPPPPPPAPATAPAPFRSAGPAAVKVVESESGDTNKTVALKFNAAPLDQVLQFYSDLTGRTLLSAPAINASVTLRSQTDLTIPEAMQAVKTVLAMNNIGLVEIGTKFVKVVPIGSVQQEGLIIQSNMWQQLVHEENDELISEIVSLKYIDPAEAQKSIAGLIHAYGKILPLERINSLLIADTTININRIKEVLNQIDQPIELKEMLRIFPIQHSKATDIKARIDEIIADQKDKDKQPTVRSLRQTGAPGVEATPPTLPGVIRARLPTAGGTAAAQTSESGTEEGQMIRGNVKIIADDRTGVLIIITRPENMPFLEQIVTALDIATSPDVSIKVVRLEYADSEEVASMLNALIGAASTPSKTTAPKTTSTTTSTDSSKSGQPAAEPARSSQLQEFIEQQRQAATSRGPEAKTKIGQLSAENIKILSDKRSNAIIIMASRGDLASIMDILKDMDIMLSQVLIEAVILQVALGSTVERGVDWVQRSMIAYDQKNGGRDPLFAYAGGGGGGKSTPRDATALTSTDAIAAGAGLTYYFTHFGLNLDAVIKWSSTDSRTKILSSPVILTTDNKEAKIDVSQELYFYKGQTPTSVGGSIAYVPNVESRKVGINLVVTPRINQKKFVVMEITQKLENQSATQVIADQGEWPVISSREISASVAVRSGETIILGGLIENNNSQTRSKIPILGDIPILGIPFRYSKSDNPRTEIIVFITPRVLDTPEEIEAESERRKQATSGKDMWQKGWSDSKLAEPPPGRVRQWWRNLLK